ncbi:MAG: right-handed parallel beta-helix repeat-containing protein [Deltaproteobacteria bacterium]|nr:right-handed parallel beta-helix repeat-containing protein [Deltaproteobacteria bacterium]
MAIAHGSMGRQRWAWALGALLVAAPACGDDGGAAGDTSNDDGGTSPTGDSGSANLPEGCDLAVNPSDDDQTAVQEAFVDVMEGQTICLGAGNFTFTRQLTLNANGVTLRGAGPTDTLLDFSEQISGGNGVLITGDDVTVEDLQVLNTPGDGIRADNVDNIAFLNVHVVWEAEASLENGAYGLYPVQSNGVTIQNSVVQGARDAGIYVGQSTAILVEDSEAFGNVAGIEIENSTDAIVRGNHAHDNTAGLLVFNLPGLEVIDGKRANLYDNVIEDNNVPNFGESGTVVALVPHGIGVLILAADNNEVADNVITGNVSAAVVVIAYVDDLFAPPDDPTFDIYAEGNFIHDNTMENNGEDPAELILAVTELTVPSPDIVYGGCFDEAKDNSDGSLTNCVSDNGEADFISVNLCGQGMIEREDTAYVCEHDPLPRDL